MCLTIKKGTGKRRAKKDIKVSKVLIKAGDEFFTLYQYFKVSIDGVYYVKMDRQRAERIQYCDNVKYFSPSVHAGLHSYLSRATAELELEWCGEEQCIIVECTIPKGSYYYLGEDDDIVSDTLCYPNKF